MKSVTIVLTSKRVWTDKEIEFMIKNYPHKSTKYISKKLNRSLGSIRAKAGLLNLKKTREFLFETKYGKNAFFYGKHHTEESNEKNRLSHIGRTPWNKGKHNIYSEKRLRKLRKHLAKYREGKNNPSYRKNVIEKRRKTMHENLKSGRLVRWNKGKTKYDYPGIAIIAKKSSLNMIKRNLVGSKNPQYGKPPTYPEPYFVKELNYKVRSSLEEDGLKILRKSGIKYKYEKPFIINLPYGKRHYWVDCHIMNSNMFIEFKGYPDKNSILKMQAFKEQYPNNKLFVVTYDEFVNVIPKYCYHEIYDINKPKLLVKNLKSGLNAK